MKLPTLPAAGTPYKVLLVVTVGLVLLVWGVRFLALPAMVRIGEQRVVLQDLKVKIADTQVLADQLSAQEAILEEARAAYEVMYDRVGERQSIARILEQLGQLAREHHLEFVAVQPRSDEEEQELIVVGPDLTLRVVSLSLQLQGRYHQIADFLGDVPEMPFLAAVQQLHMVRPSAASAQLDADLLLAVYLADEGAT